jgi:hypothetical protein
MAGPKGVALGMAAINAAKLECIRGHEFTPENTRRFIDAAGRRHRKCRRCNVVYRLRRREARR